jgi:micrococcal nuclease
VKDKYVTLVKDVSETDRYGRLLRYVWVEGVLINQQLVSEGYAVASSYPPDIARQVDLRAAEQEARTQNRGLWAACQTASPQP